MKFNTTLLVVAITGILVIRYSTCLAQPKIQFSDLSPSTEKPMILGQTSTNYYCLYATDAGSQLLVYDLDLKLQRGLNWDSILSLQTATPYQAFTLNNQLVILFHEKDSLGLNIRCVVLDEKGNRINEKLLLNDKTVRGQSYDLEISKNGEYLLLYRGVKINDKSFFFTGALFDRNFNILKQFSTPIDKDETEDSWDGAIVDIQGNVHTLVYTAADSWKLGSRIRIHTISRQTDEVKSEQIEILKKRILNYSISEDTAMHLIRLRATVAWQHQKDPLAGIAFINIPYSRVNKIGFTSYEFTREQKKLFAKNITAEKKLLTNTNFGFPSSLVTTDSYFTTLVVHSDNPEPANPKIESTQSNPLKLHELYDPNKIIPRAGTNPLIYEHAVETYDKKQLLQDIKKLSGGPAVTSNTPNSKTFTVPERLILLKNNPQGKLETSTVHLLTKAGAKYYDESIYSIVKNDAVQLLTYLMDPKGPTLYLITQDEKSDMKKLLVPAGYFLVIGSSSRTNETDSILPYLDTVSEKYGLAKITL